MPDSECNSVCPGDNLQYCGASARIQIYVNSAGSPPSPANCINWRGIYSFQNNILYTVPRTSTTPRTKLFNVRTNPLTDPNWYSIIAVSSFLTSYVLSQALNVIILIPIPDVPRGMPLDRLLQLRPDVGRRFNKL